jgi:hypothetical protein
VTATDHRARIEAETRTAIGRLRRLVELVAELPDAGGEVGQWLAAGVAAYVLGAAEGRELGDCLGLSPPQSRPGWWSIEARNRTDAKILEIDRLLFDGAPRPSVHYRAGAIAAALQKYAANAWPRARHRIAPPADPLRRLLWQYLQLRGDAPSARTVGRRLSEAERVCQPQSIALAGLSVAKTSNAHGSSKTKTARRSARSPAD